MPLVREEFGDLKLKKEELNFSREKIVGNVKTDLEVVPDSDEGDDGGLLDLGRDRLREKELLHRLVHRHEVITPLIRIYA